ncbi:MAG: hypothetical protein R3313_04165, partial [Candidatus Saccharimonadales bacterium]|nr:hypothetical protein [Candidatus Saccharimonadales bacterium]
MSACFTLVITLFTGEILVSVYSNKQIKQAIDSGQIVCVPFNEKHVSQASLDITLGKHYYRVEQLNTRHVYNPFDREDVERYFDGPYQAMEHKAWADLHGQQPL